MKTLEELFKHQLKDLYNAEQQLIQALPEFIGSSEDSALKKALEEHLDESKTHRQRLDEICKDLNIVPAGEKCIAMEGLIKEAKSFLGKGAEGDVKNAGIIANAQRIDHYEISGYGTAKRFARELGHDDIANKLDRSLQEEYRADEKLTVIAEERMNKKAKS